MSPPFIVVISVTCCDYDTRHAMAGRPFSFLRAPKPAAGSCKAPRRAFALRSWDRMKDSLARMRSMEPTAAAKAMKEEGFNTLVFAMDPDYVPGADPTQDLVQDVLHLGPDGVLRSEGAWLFFILYQMGLLESAVNARIATYPDWPPDVRIPPLHSNLRKGRRGGLPARERVLRMSGSQVLHFALHRSLAHTALLP